ncbi:tyrosine-type recombinase/integrase [Brachybacterium alimentarium]|uniref:tyrosine-type recombinase/integrase n=1 Tax=Brachybacterium alimentarium TaxID=47845 RepID=UPI003FD3DC5E
MARAKGDGSLFKDSRGYWTASITLPEGADGKRRRKTVRSKDRGKAAQKLRDLRAELDQHGDVVTATPTTKAYLERWLDTTAAQRLRPRTLDTYRGYIHRWIIPAIGRVKVSELTPRHVEAVQDLCKTGYGEGKDKKKPISSTTRLQVHRILSVALKDAVRAGHLRTNPASTDYIDAPRKRYVETDVLTAEQTKKLLAAVAVDPMAARWALALFTGMRQGECLGIEREAIDLERDLIAVRWQVQRPKSTPDESIPQRDLGEGWWLLPPKTKGSFRVVPIIGPLHAALEHHLENMPAATKKHDLLFRTERGKPITDTVDRKAWHALLDGAGLPRVRIHDARHGVATLLLEAGVDIHVIQTILGHSTVLTTKGYAHVSTKLAREGLEQMERLIAA